MPFLNDQIKYKHWVDQLVKGLQKNSDLDCQLISLEEDVITLKHKNAQYIDLTFRMNELNDLEGCKDMIKTIDNRILSYGEKFIDKDLYGSLLRKKRYLTECKETLVLKFLDIMVLLKQLEKQISSEWLKNNYTLKTINEYRKDSHTRSSTLNPSKEKLKKWWWKK